MHSPKPSSSWLINMGRYGYRRITALLQRAGWQVGKDRVERIWRREGLKVPKRQKPRGRLWLNDGSCVRLRTQHRNHVWSYDFVSASTHDGRTVRMLNLIDESTGSVWRSGWPRELDLGRYAFSTQLSDFFQRSFSCFVWCYGRNSWPRP